MMDDLLPLPQTSERSSSSRCPPLKTEECIIDGQRIKLPQALCENTELFQALLSVDSWNAFTEQQRRHLMVINETIRSLCQDWLLFQFLVHFSVYMTTLSTSFNFLIIARIWEQIKSLFLLKRSWSRQIWFELSHFLNSKFSVVSLWLLGSYFIQVVIHQLIFEKLQNSEYLYNILILFTVFEPIIRRGNFSRCLCMETCKFVLTQIAKESPRFVQLKHWFWIFPIC